MADLCPPKHQTRMRFDRLPDLRRSGWGAKLFVDAIEEAVDEAAGLVGAELLRHLECLVDRHLGWHVLHPQNLEHALPQDIPINDRHPVELPVLGELRDELVDLRLVKLRAADQDLGEFPHLPVDGMPRPELRQMRLGIALALYVELVEQLERHFARFTSLAPG